MSGISEINLQWKDFEASCHRPVLLEAGGAKGRQRLDSLRAGLRDFEESGLHNCKFGRGQGRMVRPNLFQWVGLVPDLSHLNEPPRGV